MNLRLKNKFRLFEKNCLFSIEITDKMTFHTNVSDLLDTMPDASSTLVRVQVPPSATTSTSLSSSAPRTSNKKSLFQDYFNNNVDDNQGHYDELEAYIAVKIPNVS